MKKNVNIAFVGFGVVGSGTLKLLEEHRQAVEERVGAQVQVRWICSQHKKKSSLIDDSIQQTTDWRDVVADRQVDLVVELMGGTQPAKELIIGALNSAKHVVTANKAVLSKYWDDIFDVANQKRKLVYFEAAVGGGVPVVQALNEGLAGNEIHKIVGILNGTTNYILTQMQENRTSYKAALKHAQALGFAESDPTFDVDGIDTAQKISILGSLAAGDWISPEHVYCEGITKIRELDIRLIKERYHSTIKLLGIAEKTNQGWILRVHPTLIANSHPFANVRNEYNAISLHGNAAGDVMLSGKGAGQLPTSSAVLSDIIFLCRQIANGTAGQLPYVMTREDQKIKLADMDSVRDRYYLRVNTLDKPGVLARITTVLGRNRVSIASVRQDAFDENSYKKGVPIIFLTHENLESDVQSAVKAIDKFSTTTSKTVLLRML